MALYDEGRAEYDDVRMYKVLVWSRVDGGTGLLGWAYLRVLSREVGEAGVGRMESAVPEVVVQVEETRKMSSIIASGLLYFSGWRHLLQVLLVSPFLVALYVELQRVCNVVVHNLLIHLTASNADRHHEAIGGGRVCVLESDHILWSRNCSKRLG